MAVTLRNPAGVALPVAYYSHLAVVSPGSRLLVLAGQVGNRLDGAFPETMEAQFAQALANILAIVRSEGGDARAIARLTCYVTERPNDRAALQQTMEATFGAALPTMTFIYVAGLFAAHVKVEIEAIAAVAG